MARLDPRAAQAHRSADQPHGARRHASDAFDVVIPSMPGYGFSGKPTATGWDPARMARAWVVLMKRLGYTDSVAQGGDWGGFVTNLMARRHPGVIGIHTNFLTCPPPIVAAALAGPPPAGLSADEQRAYDQMAFLYQHIPTLLDGRAPANPVRVGGLTRRPCRLDDRPRRDAAWADRAHSFDGVKEGLTRDDILDNITFSWLTNTGVSALVSIRKTRAASSST